MTDQPEQTPSLDEPAVHPNPRPMSAEADDSTADGGPDAATPTWAYGPASVPGLPWPGAVVDAALALLALAVAWQVYTSPPPWQSAVIQVGGRTGLTTDGTGSRIESAAVHVRIDEEGTAWLERQPLGAAELARRLSNYQTEQQAQARIVLTAHPRAFHRAVVRVIDALGQAGFESVELATSED